MNAHTHTWTDEQLMAFADGVLDAQDAGRLEVDFAHDEALAHRVAVLMETHALARQAWDRELDAPVPDALRRSVEAMVARDSAARAQAPASPAAETAPETPAQDHRPRVRRAPSRWARWAQGWRGFGWPAAATASMACAVVGFMVGGQWVASQGVGAGLVVGLPPPATLVALLDNVPGGASQTWPGPSGPKAQVAMIGSYRTASGELCRDFAVAPAEGAQTEVVACRTGQGPWMLRFAAQAMPDDGGYTTAASHSSAERYLAAIGAGEPLAPEAERQALRGE